MSTTIRASVLVAMLFALTSATTALAQNARSSQGARGQSDGWQGPRPTSPRQETITPAPQPSAPSGMQVLEIPAQPQQQSVRPPRQQAPEPPRQQAAIPPRPQRDAPRPRQLVTVTVTNPQGRYIPGLTREDFILYEDGMPQDITYFNTGQRELISLGLIVDTSGSMRNKIRRARQALRQFVNSIHDQDEVFLAEFNVQPSLVQDFTDSRMLLSQATTLLRPGGGTALYDAILDGLRRIQRGRHQKKALVVISDGLDTASLASLDQMAHRARHAGVLIYTIGIGNPNNRSGGGAGLSFGPFSVIVGGGDERVDSRTLQQISDDTGGKFFLLNTADVVGSASVLDTATQTISQELRHQYSLGYTPGRRKDGSYRRLRVETRRSDLVVRAQKGYAAN